MRRLIFASAPTGLAPGRTGYCTVARSPGLRERLVRELEMHSAHEPGEGACFAFRTLTVGADTFAVLTRYDDAGPDYTGRASTLAEHLVFEPAETAALPPPADIARRHTGWVRRWEGPPVLLEDDGTPTLKGTPAALPAATWKRLAGDAGKAALFCDDRGNATPGTLPAPGGEDTLTLLAEASLLLGDRGWNTPFTTRRHEPDTKAVWRTSPDISAESLRHPGLARRATLARSGAMAGERPAAGRAAPAPRARHAGAGSAPVMLSVTEEKKPPTIAIVAAAAITLGAVAVAGFLLLRAPETPTAPTATETPRAEEAPPAPPPVAPHPLVAQALAALAAGDPAGAARAWTSLKTAAPAEAESHRSDILSPTRDRLIPHTLNTAREAIFHDAAPLSTAEAARIRESLTTLPGLAGDIGARLSPDDETALRDALAALDAMLRLETALPATTLLAPAWVKSGETPFAATFTADVADDPQLASLKAFLSIPHAGFRATLSQFRGFGAPADPEALHLDIPARDFAPGKVLAINHPEHKQLLGVNFDTRGRLTLTRRHPATAPEPFLSPTPDTPLLLVLEDTTTGEKHALLLAGLGTDAETIPAKAPAALLREKDGTTDVPERLAGLLARVRCPGARPALLPEGYNGAPRDFPGLAADRTVVAQALRARIATLRSTPGASPREIRRLEDALAGLPRGAVAAGAAWRIVIAPPGGDAMVPLIRFD